MLLEEMVRFHLEDLRSEGLSQRRLAQAQVGHASVTTRIKGGFARLRHSRSQPPA